MSANSIFDDTLSLMSGNVVRLPVKPKQEATLQFYCTRCDGDQFSLFTNGPILCTKCGARIRNLTLTRKE